MKMRESKRNEEKNSTCDTRSCVTTSETKETVNR